MIDLILLRHSKAVASSPAGDRSRGINPRGVAEAVEAGHALARLGPPDFALVSDARRTRETFDRIVEAMGQRIAHRFDRGLYGATPEAILAVIAKAPAGSRRLLVVGHNPGVATLARSLAGPDDPRRGDMDAHFPTSAFAVIRLAGETWSAAGDGGRLDAYVLPKGRQGAS